MCFYVICDILHVICVGSSVLSGIGNMKGLDPTISFVKDVLGLGLKARDGPWAFGPHGALGYKGPSQMFFGVKNEYPAPKT